ncbi:protein-L-isoaspartate O-methyltransferase [Candidatus Woesearchaeota archaeon]|nr:protein-L-isoaspartate O-methyltransferase [Candidatus Woesearchaeota archaeon]
MKNQKQALLDYWIKNKIVTSKYIIDAFKKVKRENFVLKKFKSDAYEDVPLPILKEQTISQPTTVMMMLEFLELKPGMKVLEIGTGSGYNAALMAEIVGPKGKVITTETIEELVEFAKKNLKKSKITNVQVIHTDGSKGWPTAAPYDRIICTAAAPKIPEVYIKQLQEKGIIVIPVGPLYGQVMIRGKKIKGKLETERLGDFMFVPLTGKFGQ